MHTSCGREFSRHDIRNLKGEQCPQCNEKIIPARDICPSCGDEVIDQGIISTVQQGYRSYIDNRPKGLKVDAITQAELEKMYPFLKTSKDRPWIGF